MNRRKLLFAIILTLAGFGKLLASVDTCQARFGYTYSPWLSQPEQDIYLFHDSSTGEDSTTIFRWSFGVGDYSGAQNASFTYEPDDSGFEQVCLTISNTDNACNSTTCDTIRVDNLCIGARYTYSQQGNTFAFKASICGTADSINWNFGDGTIVTGTDSVSHTFAAVDSYYVCMQVFLSAECQYFYPCKAFDCQEIYIYPTDIKDITKPNQRLKVFPDPAGSYISITTSGAEFPAHIVITDVTGNIVSQSQVENAAQQLNINSLAAGVYFLQVTDGQKQSLVTRFIKQ